MNVRLLMPVILVGSLLSPVSSGLANELSYQSFIGSDHPLKCMYGYYADKTGDHASAVRIFEECAEDGSVYAMIWLGLLYEQGQGVQQSDERAVEMYRRGALTPDPAGYHVLAQYHLGLALYHGRGVRQDRVQAVYWLKQAVAGGDADADRFLKEQGLE